MSRSLSTGALVDASSLASTLVFLPVVPLLLLTVLGGQLLPLDDVVVDSAHFGLCALLMISSWLDVVADRLRAGRKEDRIPARLLPGSLHRPELRWLAWALLAVPPLLVTVALAVALPWMPGGWSPAPHIAAAALLVLHLGLMVPAWTGRRRAKL